MKVLKRILVPLDPARPFDAANQYAVDLAHHFKSSIVASYIIDEHLMGPAGDEAANSIDQALEWVGEAAMEDFARMHQELDIKKTLAYGPTATALFQVILQSGADAVVVGGFHAVAQPHVWGSVVVDVVQHAERPVFVVRKGATLPGPGKPIVVPFDASERSLANLVRIGDFAASLEAPIELIYVARSKKMEQAKAILEKGEWVLSEAGVEVNTTVLPRSFWKHKARTMLNHAKAVGSPLIALSRLGRSSIHTGRSKTVAWLVAHADLPVWVVRK